MHIRLLLLLVILFFAQSAISQSLSEGVSKFLNQPDYKNASVGIHIVDLESGETLFDLNSEKYFIPASILKLITSAVALEILGADYRFKTQIGYIGKIEKNLLKGDIVVVGGGDPTPGSEHFANYYHNFFETWAKKIKASGIGKIEGDLILDGSVYDSETIPATWIWEDIGNYYGAGPSAFSVYDNLFRITFQSPRKAGKPTKIISIYPKIEGLQIKNEVMSANNNSDNAYVFGSPLDKSRVIRGTIPKNRKTFSIKAALHQPEQLLADEFLYYLAKEGVFITGKVKYEKVNKKKFQTIYIQESPVLEEVIKILNFESINLFAEHLLKQLAFEKNRIGNHTDGIEIVKEYFRTEGVTSTNIFMEDGSGLSHFNAVSPKTFTDLLVFMNSSKNKKAFYNSLPPAGEGTLSGFHQQVFPGNTLKAKSGSMTRIRCYAGYLNLKSEKNVAFSIMVNHFTGSHSKLIQEISQLLEYSQMSEF